MILHIIPDEKFTDMAFYTFEKAAPNNNEFIVVTAVEKFQYIKTTPARKIGWMEFLSKKFAKKLLEYEFVVLHWMDSFKMQLVMNASECVKFVWIGWGGDYYDLINKPLFLPKTKELKSLLFNQRAKISIKQKIKGFIKKKIYMPDISNVEKVINRIDYFSPVLEEDYDLLKSSLKNFKPKFLDWNYGTLEDDLIRDFNSKITERNILIGNSATYENNHLEAFEMVAHLNLEDSKIICPLSYGEGTQYTEKIIQKGHELFGTRFHPLTEFIPIDDYRKIIGSCSIVIMNHLRQQAVGNIIMMMYLGAKIFLNTENPVYHFFKKRGAVIFSTNELTSQVISLPLTDGDTAVNRNILKNYWSRQVILEKTRKLIQTVGGGEDA